MVNVKKELKKESRNVPDIRENVKRELGIEKGTPHEKQRKIKWQFFAMPVCALVVVAIVLCAVLIPGGNGNIADEITQMQVNYGKAAVMAFDVMSGMTMEAGIASYESNFALVEQVNGYINSLEKYLDDSFSIALVNGKDANELKIISGKEEYYFSYNVISSDGNKTEIDGIFKAGQKEYFTEAKIETETDNEESSQCISMSMYYGKDKSSNYIRLEYEIENEGIEKETVLKYYVYENNAMVEKTEIETEIESDERSVEIFIVKGEKTFKYSYEIESDEAELVIEESDGPKISCKLIFSENGNIYKFEDYDEIIIDD